MYTRLLNLSSRVARYKRRISFSAVFSPRFFANGRSDPSGARNIIGFTLSTVPITAVDAGRRPPRFKYIRSSTISRMMHSWERALRSATFSLTSIPASRFCTARSTIMPMLPAAPRVSTGYMCDSGYFSSIAAFAICTLSKVFVIPLDKER